MTNFELRKILIYEKKLTLQQVLNIIYELKQDCFDEIYKGQEPNKERWYYGEINAFYIALDLLDKVELINDSK